MTELKKTYGEALEQIELVRLRDKYINLGYTFSVEVTRTINGRKVVLDAYAENKNTGDKIIFEVKAPQSVKPDSQKSILNQINQYKLNFPDTRVILVIARERNKSELPVSQLNDLLLSHILYYEEMNLRREIYDFIRLEHVEEIELDSIDLKDFRKIQLKGNANLLFWAVPLADDFIGRGLTSIPFYFDIELLLNEDKGDGQPVYSISEGSRIEFDWSEFKF